MTKLFALALVFFSLSARAQSTASPVVVDIIATLERALHVQCTPTEDQRIATIFTCTGSTFSFELTNVERFHLPAATGKLLTAKIDVRTRLNEYQREELMLRISLVALEHFKEYDPRTTWGQNIDHGTFLFQDPNGLITYFDDWIDQTSVPLVEMSAQDALKIFVGYAG